MTQASKQQRDILVTSALPYANGPIHLGHLLEYIQTDIWVRFQNMRGHNCYYVCADDAHGTAIMLRAEREGITPEQLIDRIRQEHQEDFAGFHIRFDNYYSTHSEENQYFSEYIYRQLKDNDHIATRKITQFFDPEKEMFLADLRRLRKHLPPAILACGLGAQDGQQVHGKVLVVVLRCARKKEVGFRAILCFLPVVESQIECLEDRGEMVFEGAPGATLSPVVHAE